MSNPTVSSEHASDRASPQASGSASDAAPASQTSPDRTPAAPAAAAPTWREALLQRNPAWVQLLGLCPALAVSSSLVHALTLALATALVLLGSNVVIAAARALIPPFARLPAFVLIIATWTTCAVMLLEAFAFEAYLGVALFVQIIVTNCIILARAETVASRAGIAVAALDALRTGAGFALALLGLGAVREIVGKGTLGAGLDRLLGPGAADWTLHLSGDAGGLLLVSLPPGAFLTAGLLLALGQALARTGRGTDAGTPRARDTEGSAIDADRIRPAENTRTLR